jgi:hypothetical protein
LAKVIEYCKKHVGAASSKDKLFDDDEFNKWMDVSVSPTQLSLIMCLNIRILTHTFFLGIGHFSAFLIYFQFHYDSCHA